MATMSIEITGKYYSCAEAAKMIGGLTPDTVRRYCNSDPPRIYGEKIGRDWLIPASEIKRYKKERGTQGRPPAA